MEKLPNSTQLENQEDQKNGAEAFTADFEKEVMPEAEECFDILEEIEDKLNRNKKTFSKELVRKIIRQSAEILYSALRIIPFSYSLALALQMTLTENAQSVKSISEIDTEDGVGYVHSDPTTTKILNYFAGKDTLSESEIFHLFKNDIRGHLEKEEIQNIPDNFDQMNHDELKEFLIERWFINLKPETEEDSSYIRRAAEATIKQIYDAVPRSFKYDPEYYQALWQITEEVGAPEIRFMESNMEHNRADNRSYYSPLTHTITLNMIGETDSFDTLFEEFAHAKQFSGNTLPSIHKFNYDVFSRIGRSALNLKSMYDSQLDDYNKSGTLENEAHSLIAPRLKQAFREKIDRLSNEQLASNTP